MQQRINVQTQRFTLCEGITAHSEVCVCGKCPDNETPIGYIQLLLALNSALVIENHLEKATKLLADIKAIQTVNKIVTSVCNRPEIIDEVHQAFANDLISDSGFDTIKNALELYYGVLYAKEVIANKGRKLQ